MNPKSVIRLLSYIVLFMAAIMLVPTAVSYGYGEGKVVLSFAMAIVPMLFIAAIGIAFTKDVRDMRISVKDSYLFVSLSWITLTFFGALPLYFSGVLGNFSLCFFEIMSGFTTTGATAMSGLDTTYKGILFWRSMTNWLGGMGIVVLFVAILPALGVKGTALYGAESVGPTKDKLRPKIKETAIILWSIYLGISLLEFVLLLFGGIGWFDAICVTFSTMGAAGYAPHDLSIAFYQSAYVEWVCIIFMFLSGANFALYYWVLHRKFDKMLADGEFRLYLKIVLGSVLLIVINLLSKGLYGLWDALRYASFHVVSLMTTTGFTSTDYTLWPAFSQIILLLLCFIGGCSGSASGGIKVVRIGVMARLFRNSMRRRIHPNAVTEVRLGNCTYSASTVEGIAGFVVFYITNVIVATLLISLTGIDLLIGFTSVVLTIGNVGVGFGGIGTSYTFAIYPDWAIWLFSFLMLVGRLELYTVYALFTRDFWHR